MVVYLDILLLENFIVNTFLIYITAQTLKINTKFRFLILSGFIGSLYVLTLIYPYLQFLTSLFFKILIAILMMIIAFRKVPLLFYIKASCIFIMYSFFLGGFCFFIEFSYTNALTLQNGWKVYPNKFIIMVIMISYITVHRIVIYIKDRKDISKLIYNVEIVFGERIININAFLDTGNELKEPATNLPVIVVEKNIFTDLNLNENDKYYIPFQLANGTSGFMEGFKPSKVSININGSYMCSEVIIALTDAKFSRINDYNALLSRGIV